MKKLMLSITLFMLSVLALIPVNANALSITFTTPIGATEAGGNPVSSSATFVTSADSITITLTNTLSDPTTVAQNLSDLGFSLSTGQTSGTLTSSAGMERNVATDGTYTDGSVVATGWGLESIISPAGLLLNVLGTSTAPAHTIIGSPNASNLYASANNSIAGNDPHNPFLAGPVTFTLSVLGVTADTAIENVFFSYGTTAGNNVQAPEPSSMILLGFALIGLWGARKKSKK